MSAELRSWLLTSTTYGTWLPGDRRGFVGRVWESRPGDSATTAKRIEHDIPGTPYDREIPGLQTAAAHRMTGPSILFNPDQAQAILAQFEQTAEYRGWLLHAASAMANHVHLVVAAPALVLTDDLLRDFKSYASRALSRRWGKPTSGTWWTASGSRRSLPSDDAVASAIRYVLNQHRFLARWLHPSHGSIERWLPKTEK